MKQMLAFIRKEAFHILRDRRSMMILLIMPVIQILLFGSALSTEVRNVKVAVVDPSKDEVTAVIKERIKASEYFEIVGNLDSPEMINDAFNEGRIDLAVVFSSGFAEGLVRGDAAIQLIADGTDPNQASLLTGYASGILSSYASEQLGGMLAGALIRPEIKMLYNPQTKSSYNFVPGVLGLIMMLICAMMTSVSIVREKETGTMEVLLSSPMKPIYIILAKAVPYIILSLLNFISIMVLSVTVLDVPVRGSFLLLLGISLLFILLCLSLGLLISTLVKTQMAAILASGMGLMTPVMLLSGLIFPIASMPGILQGVSTLVPARWYIQAVRKVMIQGVGFQFVSIEVLILSLMTLVLLTLALRKFNIRLN